jgi:NAD(P)H-nitrite reductase large subunit
VENLDTAGKELLLEHKEILPFDGLIIAVGGRPRIPERLSVYRDLMFTLKTVEDARAWIGRLNEADSVLMIGGDLTSLAMTRALIHLNKRIYFMLDEEAFWPLRCDKGLLAKVAHALALRGVEVLIFRQIRSIARLPDGSCEVKMDEGSLQVGMVGAFFGLVPDVRFLARSGLPIDRGVLVDEYLNTGVDDIYATGDCAQIYHTGIKDYWVSIGYDNARLLGHIAGINLASGGMKVSTRPESVFDVKGIKVNTSWWMDF